MVITADVVLHKVFKINSQEITLKIIIMLVCLQPLLGYEEAPSPRKELKKAADLLADGWDL